MSDMSYRDVYTGDERRFSRHTARRRMISPRAIFDARRSRYQMTRRHIECRKSRCCDGRFLAMRFDAARGRRASCRQRPGFRRCARDFAAGCRAMNNTLVTARRCLLDAGFTALPFIEEGALRICRFRAAGFIIGAAHVTPKWLYDAVISGARRARITACDALTCLAAGVAIESISARFYSPRCGRESWLPLYRDDDEALHFSRLLLPPISYMTSTAHTTTGNEHARSWRWQLLASHCRRLSMPVAIGETGIEPSTLCHALIYLPFTPTITLKHAGHHSGNRCGLIYSA